MDKSGHPAKISKTKVLEEPLANGVHVGKLKEKQLVITHETISRDHCAITTAGLEDHSSIGTFMLLRNIDEVVNNAQSSWIEVNPNMPISFAEY